MATVQDGGCRIRCSLVEASRLALALYAVSILGACSTLPNGRSWGEDVTARPGWARLGQAALQTIRKPSFWAPLAAAGVTQIDGWDRRISNWGRRHVPLFRSEANAAAWSNYLRSASVVSGWISIVVAPSGPFGGGWLIDKINGSAVDVLAAEAAIESTSGIKRLAKRERPNGYDDLSMPSDHTTTAAVYNQLAVENLQLSGFDQRLRLGADIFLEGLTAATGWARVEAGAHFPSDTLVGASIGNFFAGFFTAGFLAAPDSRTRLHVQSVPGGAMLQWRFAF